MTPLFNRGSGPAGDGGDRRPVVLLANPQNGRGSSAGRSPYPNLGLLTLATALEAAVDPDAAVVWYYDGALLGDDGLSTLIAKHGHRIEVLGLSAYTYNFEQCIRHARALKATRPSARVAMGNDHFSARHAQILARNASVVDCGFVGNDVVESFARWVRDVLAKREMPLTSYPGLTVLRDGQIHRQAEQPQEYVRLPLVDYGLQDSYTSHRASYRAEQQELYSYLRDSGREIGLVDFARGCLKFAGPRTSSGTPLSACEFCGIIPGAKAIASLSSTRAWQTIGNAFDQGYRYLFATADELPWTFWPLLRSMAATKPDWYLDLHRDDRPRLMCYARADVFKPDFAERIDLAIQDLLVDHFVVGLDGLTEDSLRSMNKPMGSGRAGEGSMLEENFRACSEIQRRGAKLTAGVVLTHIGSTPDLLEEGFKTLTGLLGRYRNAFVEIDFELFCPIPGSLAYDYFQVPETGVRRARELGVDLRESALMAKSQRYADADFIDPEEMIDDFIEVFCPAIDRPMANAYLDRIRNAVEDLGLVYECGSL